MSSWASQEKQRKIKGQGMNITLGDAGKAITPSGALVTAASFVTGMWATVGVTNLSVICGTVIVSIAIVCASVEKMVASRGSKHDAD